MTVPRFHKPAYRPDIDGLRALAVLSVVAFHASPAWLKAGFIGVDMFFVISGYLISSIILENLAGQSFSFATFYARRIRRIFPALIVVMAGTAALGWFALLAEEYRQFGWHLLGGASFLSNYFLWQEAGYFDQAAHAKPLLHLWSLAIEEQFYLLWPATLWLCHRSGRHFLSLILVIAAASLALNLHQVGLDSTAAFYSPQTRFWELMCGSLLAWHHLQTHGQPRPLGVAGATICGTLGILALLLGFAFINRDTAFPGAWAVLPVASTVLLIAAGPQAWFNRRVLAHPFLVGIGLISYPLYLWHWPLLSFAHIVEGKLPSQGLRLMAVALAWGLAWLTYRGLEQPMRRGKLSGAKVLGLVLALSALGAAGLWLQWQHGLPTRGAISAYQDQNRELTRSPARDQACLDYVGIAAPAFAYCRYTDGGGSGTVVIFGDSHAHAAYAGIAEYLQARHINTLLLANSGFPSFLDIRTAPLDKEASQHRLGTQQMLAVLAQHPDIRQVFIFTRGPYYFTGVQPVSGETAIPQVRKISLADFVCSAQATVNAMARPGLMIYYVLENPELHHDISRCFPRPLRATHEDCRPVSAQVMARFQAYREQLGGLRNLRLVDPIPIFCPSERCLLQDAQGNLLYADSDHLSLSGSRFLTQKLLAPYLTPP